MALQNGTQKAKVVFILGATGSGKTKLSIDLATYFNAEIINSDKMQVYKGLNIVTNKITETEQFGIPHHLVGVLEPFAEFSPSDFRRLVLQSLDSIVERNRLPIITGGSNNYIEALVDDEDHEFRSKYECCFIWVNCSLDVSHMYVSRRVDQMVRAGLVEEVREFFDPKADYERGVKRSIGVPEMDMYFRMESTANEDRRREILEIAIEEIKINTCKLARTQIEKIRRLRDLPGWNVRCVDSTKTFLNSGIKAVESWEKSVVRPSISIIKQFLNTGTNTNRKVDSSVTPAKATTSTAAKATTTTTTAT